MQGKIEEVKVQMNQYLQHADPSNTGVVRLNGVAELLHHVGMEKAEVMELLLESGACLLQYRPFLDYLFSAALQSARLMQSGSLTNIASKEEQEARDLKIKLTKVEGQASVEIQELRAELDKIRGAPQAPQLNGGNAQSTPNSAVPPAAPPANQSLRDATEPKTTQRLWEVEITNLFWRQKKEHGKEIFEGNDKEKHTPYLHLNGDKGTVIVGKGIEGNPYHPMKASENPDEVHFIQNVWVTDQHGKCVAMHHLDPYSQDKAEFTFDIPPWATKLKPYEFCNMHGLWDGPEVVLPQAASTVDKMGQPQPKSWRYIIADLHRQQKKHHNKPEPFLGNDKEKHTPYISFHGNKVRVTVGLGREGSPYHPMKDSTNPAELHYITHIYILDQDNNCVALEALDPTGLDIAVSEFDLGTIPMSTSKLTPYEHCNWHGLWVGPSADAPMNAQQQ